MPEVVDYPDELLVDGQRAELEELARRELGWYPEYAFGLENAPYQDEWYAILQNRAVQINPANPKSPIRFLRPDEPDANNDLVMIEAPREHAKSSIFTVTYPTWEIGRNPNVRIVIASNVQTVSESFVREITGVIENSERYHRIFGYLKPANRMNKWNEREIIVKRGNLRLKDPTVSATSIGGAVISKRADIIICDDIITFENARTESQRQKVRDWFWNVLYPVLSPGGRLIVVGTAWYTTDFYQELLANKVFSVRKVYDSFVDEAAGKTLWPAKYPMTELRKRKRLMGSVAFNRSYRNIVTSPEDSPFREQWLEAAIERGKDRKLVRTIDYSGWDLGKLTIAVGVDLAISKREGSDYTAMGVLGMTRDGMKIPLYAIRLRLSPAQQRRAIIELYERYGPEIVIVESNAYQAALQQDMADQTDLPIRGYTTGGEKFDEEIGINSLAVEFENGKWIIPYSSEDPYTTSLMDHFLNGMREFSPEGGEHTEDLLMAFWFANNGLRQLRKKRGGKVAFRRGGNPRRRLGGSLRR